MDDLDGRDGSEAPSSSSDFYNTTSPGDRPHLHPPEEAPVPERLQATTATDDQDAVAGKDEDSSSEMDLSVSSRASSPEPEPEPEPHTGAKRRLSATFDNAQVADELTDATEDLAKRRRVSAGPSPAANGNAQEPAELPELPVEIWQHVLSYLPPAMLCRLLRVSRSFKAYLTDTVATPAARGNRSHVCVLDSEAIWTQARKIWLGKLPRPLPRCTELQMLQLIGGKTCQFCNRAPVPSPATTVYNSGPGPDGCRVIWSFGIRACGRCIEGHTLTVSLHSMLLVLLTTNCSIGHPNPPIACQLAKKGHLVHIPDSRPQPCPGNAASNARRYPGFPSRHQKVLPAG